MTTINIKLIDSKKEKQYIWLEGENPFVNGYNIVVDNAELMDYIDELKNLLTDFGYDCFVHLDWTTALEVYDSKQTTTDKITFSM